MYQKRYTDNAEIRKLSQLYSAKSVLVTFMDWGIIVLTISVSIFIAHPAVYVFSCLLIGSRMYALYSLLHEGIHYLHFRNKRWNDVFTCLFLAWPLGISLYKMRSSHLKHHKYLQTDDDPEMTHLQYDEFQFPKKTGSILLIFIKDILGINFVYYFIIRQLKLIASIFKGNDVMTGHTRTFHKEDIFKWIYYIMGGSLILFFGGWKYYILCWLIPYATVYQVLNRLRLSTEHFQLEEDQAFKTRSVLPGIPEKFIFTPHNLGYHTEHHLYPSVPFYHLPELHKMLMKQPEYRKEILKEKSYRQVIKHFIN